MSWTLEGPVIEAVKRHFGVFFSYAADRFAPWFLKKKPVSQDRVPFLWRFGVGYFLACFVLALQAANLRQNLAGLMQNR
jgi:hypothetical protein